MKEAGEVLSSHNRPRSSFSKRATTPHLRFLHMSIIQNPDIRTCSNQAPSPGPQLRMTKVIPPCQSRVRALNSCKKRVEARRVRSLYAIGLCDPAFMHETRVWAFQIGDSGTGTQCVLYLITTPVVSTNKHAVSWGMPLDALQRLENFAVWKAT
jgi:hypothetical protein